MNNYFIAAIVFAIITVIVAVVFHPRDEDVLKGLWVIPAFLAGVFVVWGFSYNANIKKFKLIDRQLISDSYMLDNDEGLVVNAKNGEKVVFDGSDLKHVVLVPRVQFPSASLQDNGWSFMMTIPYDYSNMQPN